MNITAWLLFGLINSLIITSSEPDPERSGVMGAAILGMLGALTGGTLAFLFFGGFSSSGFSTTFTFVLLIEGMLLVMLWFGKLFRRIA